MWCHFKTITRHCKECGCCRETTKTTVGEIPHSSAFEICKNDMEERKENGPRTISHRNSQILFKEWPLIYNLNFLLYDEVFFGHFRKIQTQHLITIHLILMFSWYFFPHIFSGGMVWTLCNSQVYVLALTMFTQPSLTHHNLKPDLIYFFFFFFFIINQHPWLWLYYHINIFGCHKSNCTLSPTHILTHFTVCTNYKIPVLRNHVYFWYCTNSHCFCRLSLNASGNIYLSLTGMHSFLWTKGLPGRILVIGHQASPRKTWMFSEKLNYNPFNTDL